MPWFITSMQYPETPGASVREALSADVPRICDLARQLGYDITSAHVQRHLQSLGSRRCLFVAVVPRAGVVGWIEIGLSGGMLAPGGAQIEGLVVEDEFRNTGIGSQLVAVASEWAQRHGCSTLWVESNVRRERAHRFYTKLGFQVLKQECVFTRQL